MKKWMLTLLPLAAMQLGFCQSSEPNIRQLKLPVAHELATNAQEGMSSLHVETPQIAKWKEGYALTYVDINRRSWLCFLDANFKQVANAVEIKDRVVFQLVTDNDELAILSAKRRYADAERQTVTYKEVYFSKIDPRGSFLMDVLLGGGTEIKKPQKTELDNIGNYRMIWDKDAYLANFPIQFNFSKTSKPDIHQGDAVFRIEPSGKLILVSDWNTSHSFQQFPLSGKDYFITLTKGDGPRGLNVHHFSRAGEWEEYEDKTFPQCTQSWESEEYFSCNPYPVPGGDGENYVPYMIGDGLVLEGDKVLTGFSTSNGRKSYDIGLVIASPSKSSPFSKIKWLSDSPAYTEHSLRLHPLPDGRILVLWKSFATLAANGWLEKLEDQFEEEDADEDLIQQESSPDEQWMGIIDTKGNWLLEPVQISAPTYYASDWKEDATDWHFFMDSYLDHTYSPIISGHRNEVIWLFHRPFSNELLLNVLIP
jgi:hypothetical protein